MTEGLTKEQLIEIVRRIMNAEGTDEELNELEDVLEKNVPHPEVCDLIFYSDEELTPEEIVEKALSYEPIRLPASLDQHENPDT